MKDVSVQPKLVDVRTMIDKTAGQQLENCPVVKLVQYFHLTQCNECNLKHICFTLYLSVLMSLMLGKEKNTWDAVFFFLKAWCF